MSILKINIDDYIKSQEILETWQKIFKELIKPSLVEVIHSHEDIISVFTNVYTYFPPVIQYEIISSAPDELMLYLKEAGYIVKKDGGNRIYVIFNIYDILGIKEQIQCFI